MKKIEIKNKIIEIENTTYDLTWSNLSSKIRNKINSEDILVRIINTNFTHNKLIFHTSLVKSNKKPILPSILEFHPFKKKNKSYSFIVLSLIPTGVRAEIGGFAGDATPVTNLLASVCDHLITNPNSVTASDLYFAKENILYLEGNLISHFMLNNLELRLDKIEKIGIVIEKPKENKFLNNVLNALNAMQATAGLLIDPVVVTSNFFRIECQLSPSGLSSGLFYELDDLFNALDVMKKHNSQAVAIVSSLDLDDDVRKKYYNGFSIPNPWGGAEAILTHTITTFYPFNAAHAPLLSDLSHMMFGTLGDPRDAAELISSSYLCSVIMGLSRSPNILYSNSLGYSDPHNISVNDLSAIIMPENTFGNIPFFVGLELNIPIILVRQNRTLNKLNSEIIDRCINYNNIYYVNTYAEAAGYLLALKEGISINSINRPILKLKPLYLDKDVK